MGDSGPSKPDALWAVAYPSACSLGRDLTIVRLQQHGPIGKTPVLHKGTKEVWHASLFTSLQNAVADCRIQCMINKRPHIRGPTTDDERGIGRPKRRARQGQFSKSLFEGLCDESIIKIQLYQRYTQSINQYANQTLQPFLPSIARR